MIKCKRRTMHGKRRRRSPIKQTQQWQGLNSASEKKEAGSWEGLSPSKGTSSYKNVKEVTGINKTIVDNVVDFIVPDNAFEAVTYVGGGHILKNIPKLRKSASSFAANVSKFFRGGE
jgi:hypothetical protein